jgi:hypothetical protein
MTKFFTISIKVIIVLIFLSLIILLGRSIHEDDKKYNILIRQQDRGYKTNKIDSIVDDRIYFISNQKQQITIKGNYTIIIKK